jgi:tetratricopeptide (TPR) repeat protein
MLRPELTARLQRAVAQHRAGRLHAAEAVYREVLALLPEQPDSLHLLGLVELQRGRAGEAAALIRRAITAAPDRAGYHNDLGEALRAAGDGAGARAAYGQAVALAPGFALGHYNLANLLADGGEAEAVAHYELAIAAEPGFAAAYNNLGNLLQRLGRADAAVAVYDRAVAAGAGSAETHYNRGNALHATGQSAAAIEAYRQAVTLDVDLAAAHANLAAALQAQGRTAEAVASMGRAAAIDRTHLGRRREHRELIARLVPDWHFAMMNDERRNAAYARALARHITPETHVLEIGTGGGLLAMLAARAGARHVTTCEMVELVAEMARTIVAANGLAERITVIGKPSTALEVGVDLPARADLLVSEILSSEFIGEGVLPAIGHAMRELVAPGARSIPLGGAAIGCLVGGADLARRCFAGRAAGFDLSAFNAFLPPVLTLRLQDFAVEWLSAPVELAAYRLPQAQLCAGARPVAFTATAAALCLGVAQWIRIDLDEQESFANDPREDIGRDSSAWQHLVYTLVEPIHVEPGQTVRFLVEETPGKLLIEPAG